MINSVSYPNLERNYCLFDSSRIEQKKDIKKIKTSLENPQSKDDIVESLYVLNLMLDEVISNNDDDKIKDIANLYPILSKYNQVKEPNIQTFLAGIYRKIKVPDAFGPLCVMLIQNAINPHKNCPFDPNEEIGGAILDYLG